MSIEKKATSWPVVGFSLRLTRTAPLLPVAGGVIVGVLVDNAAKPPRELYLICFGLLCLAAVRVRIRMRFGVLVIALASAATGAIRYADAYRVIPPNGIQRYTADLDGDRRLVRLQGTVVAQPRVTAKPPNWPFARWTYRNERTTFLLDVEKLKGESGEIAVTGRIRVAVHDAVLDLRPDDRVEVLGWLYAFRGPRNPGSFDWATYLRRHGVVAGLSCSVRQNIKRLSISRPRRHGVLEACRRRISDLLIDTTAIDSQDETSLLQAILLGRRSRVSRELNEVFIRAGCAHFLAVSGVHIVIVMCLARFFAGMVFKSPQLRIVAVLLTVVAYTLLAEPRPPILRAGTMASLYCVAQLMGRSRSYLNWISAAAVVLVLWNPATVFDAGFQLSFSAVLGVAYLAPALRSAIASLARSRKMLSSARSVESPAFSPVDHQGLGRRIVPMIRQRYRRFIHNLAFGFAVSLAAWLAGAPIVAAHFERLQPWGPLNSLVVFPLVGIVMTLGLGKLIAAPVLPSLSELFGWLLLRAERILLDFVAFLGDLPGANVAIRAAPWWWIVSFYFLLAMFVWRFRSHATRFVHRDSPSESSSVAARRWAGWGTVFAALLVCVSTVVWKWPATTGRRLIVTTLAVGAGTATVIQLPSGETLLYDAGSASPFDVGRTTIVPFLRSRGISRLDGVFISHPNLDHFSGIPSILREMAAGPVHINEYFDDLSPRGSPARHLLQLLSEQGHDLRVETAADTVWTYADVRLERLWPPADGMHKLSPNDASWVLRLSYLGHSVLMTGDIEELPLRELAARDDVHADVLFLPHHGGVQPSLSEFLEAVAPRVLVRSSHRRTADTLSGLAEIVGSRPLFNTADIGAVEIVLDESGVHVSTATTESYQFSVVSLERVPRKTEN